MSGPPRQLLKLKLNTAGLKNEDSASTPTPGSGKIKLKIPGGSATPKTEKPAEDVKTAPRKSIIKVSNPKKNKPPKLNPPKKRGAASLNDTDQDNTTTPSTVKIPKVKLNVKRPTKPITPSSIKLNVRRPPIRPKGVGYDSEASDAEKDPSIEENFILRMVPGEDCEYVRQAIQDRNWGKEGANIRLKFLQNNGRRAVLSVRGHLYAAIFVDLPCIVEGAKSWDKKAWYKVSDVYQMVMVLGLVQNETEALTFPIPEREVDQKTWAYAHGLTPPMHWVRKRRFRKRTSTHTIEEVEAQVQKLLEADATAIGEVRYEIVDPHKAAAQSTQAGSDQSDMEVDDELDGEGEDNAEGAGYDAEIVPRAIEEVDVDDDLEAQFESFMAQDEPEGAMEVEDGETPGSSSAVVIEPHQNEFSEAETPAAGTTSKDESDEDESDEDEEEVDEDELEQRADMQRQREEITDLESAIQDQIAELDRVQSNMLKKKIQTKIQSLKADLELKKAAIGEGEED